MKLNRRTMTLLISAFGIAFLVAGNAASAWAQRAPANCGVDCRRGPLQNPRLSGKFGSTALSILIYDHNSIHQHGLTALANLGFAFTRGVSEDFVTLLTSQTWDIVIMDFPSNYPGGDWETPLVNHIAGGGRVIISFWDLDVFTNLKTALQVATNGEESSGTAVTSKWTNGPDGGDRIWLKPNPLTGFIGDGHSHWGDKGDHLSTSGSTAVGGFVTPPTATDASVVIGNSGRTVVLGFLTDLLNNDDSGNGKPDGVDILENAIKRVSGVD